MAQPAILWTEEEWNQNVVRFVSEKFSDQDRVTQIRIMELMASSIVVGQILGNDFMQREVLRRRQSEYDSIECPEWDRPLEFQRKMRTESRMKLVGILYSGTPEDQCRLQSLSYCLGPVFSCPGFESKAKEMRDNDGLKFGRIFYELKTACLFRANGVGLKFLAAKGTKACEFSVNEEYFIECKQPEGEVTSETPLISSFSNYLEDMLGKVPEGKKGILFVWIPSMRRLDRQTKRHIELSLARAYKKVESSSPEIWDVVGATVIVGQFFREIEESGISTTSMEYQIIAPCFEGTEYPLFPVEVKRAINIVPSLPFRMRWILDPFA